MHRALLATLLLAGTSLLGAPPQDREPLRHFILEPQHALRPNDIVTLEAEGVTIQRAVGANRYLVLVPEGADLASDVRIRSLRPYEWTSKVARSAYAEAARGNAFARLQIVFHDEVRFDEARASIEGAGGMVESPLLVGYDWPKRVTVRLPSGALQTMARDERVFGIYGPPLHPAPSNATAALLSHVPPVYDPPYGLSGAGVSLSLFETGGRADVTHPEFGGRGFQDSTAPTGFHATHVMGTMIASGLASRAKGMAPGATAHQFDVTDLFPADIESHWTTADHPVADNNSWDFSLGWQGTVWYANEDGFGAYDSAYSKPYDAIALKSGVPLLIRAAGNDGNQGMPALGGEWSAHQHFDYTAGKTDPNTFCYSKNGSGTDCPAGTCGTGTKYCETKRHPTYGPFATINLMASVKNAIAVGAVDTSLGIAEFSSRGPTQDGRVKPDLIAKGVRQFSTITGGGYAEASGTSAAAPVVTGISALLVEQWRKTFAGLTPPAPVLKALLIAGADDQVGTPGLDLPGPDYTYGFGLVDAKASVDLIRADNGTGSRVRTGTLANGESVEFPLWLLTRQDLRVVLTWFDPEVALPPATDTTDPLADKTLINDLDVKVFDPSGATALPYVLDPANPTNAATRGVNSVDTTEVLEIKSAPAGRYRVLVSAKIGDTVNHPRQDFVLVANGSMTTAAPPCGDLYEPNDTEGTAYKYLVSAETISAKICSATDVDFYDANVTRAGQLTVTVTATDTPLRATLSGNGLTPLVVEVPVRATRTLSATSSVGIYVIKVEPTAAIGTDNSYTLSASFGTYTPPRRRAARH